MLGMKIKPNFKRQPPAIFLKEWRDSKNYTQEEALDRLETICGLKLTLASLSRLENSKTPASTTQLEAFAEVYETSVAALVSRPPGVEEGIRAAAEGLTEEDVKAVVNLIIAYKAGKRAAG